MTMTRRREQLVVFRLTDLELRTLKRVCEARGGRNLSEFARTELLSGARPVEVAVLNRELASMERHLSCLEASYKEAVCRLSAVQGVKVSRRGTDSNGVRSVALNR